jgi:hypothetical protein
MAVMADTKFNQWVEENGETHSSSIAPIQNGVALHAQIEVESSGADHNHKDVRVVVNDRIKNNMLTNSHLTDLPRQFGE